MAADIISSILYRMGIKDWQEAMSERHHSCTTMDNVKSVSDARQPAAARKHGVAQNRADDIARTQLIYQNPVY